MRLINTTTYQLKVWAEEEKPSYAILSHRWREEEVTLSDLARPNEQLKKLQGWKKLEHFCAAACSFKYEWAWDDTCCIDKSNSVELSTSLNSMYQWYRDAGICFAYLDDVENMDKEDPASDDSSFRGSGWWGRGWTLQELVAPKTVLFMSKDWVPIGTRRSLAEAIEEITSIDLDILTRDRFPDSVSIARRMAWAAQRTTTCVEDRAYSLMGIFGVYMPTIYGEGERAFIRLQLEIIRQSADQSIFAWGPSLRYGIYKDNAPTLVPDGGWRNDFRGLLASSPDVFKGCGRIKSIAVDELARFTGKPIDVPEYDITNFGIRIHLHRYYDSTRDKYFVLLACKDADTDCLVALLVCPKSGSHNQYYVGMDAANRPLQLHSSSWYPYFRTFFIDPYRRDPDSREPLGHNKIIANATVTRMYLHSHNLNPERSRRMGMEGGMLRLVSREVCSDTARTPPSKYHFRIPGWLIRGLNKIASFTTILPGQTNLEPNAGRTPRAGWKEDRRVGTILTLPCLSNASAPLTHHGVILFRAPGDDKISDFAFAVSIGVLSVSSTVWATVTFRNPLGVKEWADDDYIVAKKVWTWLQAKVDKALYDEYRIDDGQRWVNGSCEFVNPYNQMEKVKLTFTPLLAADEVRTNDRTLAYTVTLDVDFGEGRRMWDINRERRQSDLWGMSTT